MSARLAFVLATVLLFVIPPTIADAQTVGLVETEDGGALGRRLAAELRTRGYEVRMLAPDEASLEGSDVQALVWTTDLPARLRLCAVTRAGALRCEELAEGDASLLVLQGVEVLRAHLGEPGTPLETQPRESQAETAEAEVAPPPAPACPEDPSPSAWRRRIVDVGAGPVLLVPTSTLGAGVGLTLFATWSPDPWIALSLGGLMSLFDPALSVASGSASFATRAVWVELDLRIPEALLGGHHLLVGLAAGLGGAEVHPGAAAPFDERPAALTAFLPMVRAAFVAHLLDWLFLSVGARVGAALPQPVLFFGGDEVARWAAPLVAIELGLSVAL
jgi:hypothetical protein